MTNNCLLKENLTAMQQEKKLFVGVMKVLGETSSKEATAKQDQTGTN